MEKSNRLGGQEYQALIVLVMASVVFFGTPRRFFVIGANAAWLTVIIATLVAAVSVGIVGYFLQKHPGKGLVELTTLALGPVIGTAVNMLFFLYFLVIASLDVRLLGEAIVVTALPEIPISVLSICTVVFAMYASVRGWNAIAKACWVALPFVSVGAIIPLVLTAGRWNPDYFFPLLGSGIKHLVIGGFQGAGVLGDVLIAAILARTLQPEVRPLRISIQAVFATGLFILLVVLATSMVFPYPVSDQLALPYYMLSRALSFGRFLQRLEAVALVMWAFAIVFKIAIAMNASLYVFDQIFQIKDHRPTVVPFGAIVFAGAMIPRSLIVAMDVAWKWMFYYGGIISLAIPMLVALIGLFRLKGMEKKEAQQ